MGFKCHISVAADLSALRPCTVIARHPAFCVNICTVSLDFGLFLILHITKGYNFVKCTNTKCITQKVLLNFAKYEEKMLTQFRVFY